MSSRLSSASSVGGNSSSAKSHAAPSHALLALLPKKDGSTRDRNGQIIPAKDNVHHSTRDLAQRRANELSLLPEKETFLKPRPNAEIVTEEDFVEGLSAIIERDFFPDLPKLRLQNELFSLPRDGTIETEQARMEIAKEILALEKREEHKDVYNPSDVTRIVQRTDNGKYTTLNTKNMTLDEYNAKYLSEDNASFREIFEKDMQKKRQKEAYVEKKEEHDRLQIALENSEKLAIEYSGAQFIDQNLKHLRDAFAEDSAKIGKTERQNNPHWWKKHRKKDEEGKAVNTVETATTVTETRTLEKGSKLLKEQLKMPFADQSREHVFGLTKVAAEEEFDPITDRQNYLVQQQIQDFRDESKMLENGGGKNGSSTFDDLAIPIAPRLALVAPPSKNSEDSENRKLDLPTPKSPGGKQLLTTEALDKRLDWDEGGESPVAVGGGGGAFISPQGEDFSSTGAAAPGPQHQNDNTAGASSASGVLAKIGSNNRGQQIIASTTSTTAGTKKGLVQESEQKLELVSARNPETLALKTQASHTARNSLYFNPKGIIPASHLRRQKGETNFSGTRFPVRSNYTKEAKAQEQKRLKKMEDEHKLRSHLVMAEEGEFGGPTGRMQKDDTFMHTPSLDPDQMVENGMMSPLMTYGAIASTPLLVDQPVVPTHFDESDVKRAGAAKQGESDNTTFFVPTISTHEKKRERMEKDKKHGKREMKEKQLQYMRDMGVNVVGPGETNFGSQTPMSEGGRTPNQHHVGGGNNASSAASVVSRSARSSGGVSVGNSGKHIQLSDKAIRALNSGQLSRLPGHLTPNYSSIFSGAASSSRGGRTGGGGTTGGGGMSSAAKKEGVSAQRQLAKFARNLGQGTPSMNVHASLRTPSLATDIPAAPPLKKQKM
ncbi:unnamed protein product [Amoebophrya sp. A120]|nr:unnamed protein product [Amoebophrya sp. A120]|eukprot:GSA120T00021553001.1